MKRAIALTAAVTASLALLPAPARAATITPVALPFLWPNSALTDVEADSASDVWVTGTQGAYCVKWPWDLGCKTGSSGNPVVRRWTGSSWREYPIQGLRYGGPMSAVTTSGAEAWILGEGYVDYEYIGRFDGTAFQRVPPPAARVGFLHTGPAGTWTASAQPGSHVMFRWSGTGWTGTQAPSKLWWVEDAASAVAGEAFAVGLQKPAEPGSPTGPAMARWDGAAWHDVPLPDGVDRYLREVSPVGAGELWAASEKELVHLKAGAWTVVKLPEGTYGPKGLHVDGSGAPLVTLTTGNGINQLYRHSGGSWQLPAGDSSGSFSAVSHVPGTGVLWGVGVRDSKAAAYRIEP